MHKIANNSGWTNFADIYPYLRPPLRPSVEDVEILRAAIATNNGNVILLGVTPELASLGSRLIAVDGSVRMVQEVWPGNDATRQAICANWLNLPAETSSIDAVIGDGSINSSSGDIRASLDEIQRVLKAGGVSAFRVFCSPESAENLDDIRHDIENNRPGNFHALKWRIAMALAAETPDWLVPVANIRSTFNRVFPDRSRLQSSTGWSPADITTIDYYESAGHSLRFPSVRWLREIATDYFSSIRFVTPTGYPLADRCPTMVLTQ